jgi:hypothetical protein
LGEPAAIVSATISTGKCFHTWRARQADGEWRVAAKMVERFEDFNDNAEPLFATPEEGLNR